MPSTGMSSAAAASNRRLIFHSAYTGTRRTYTYAELLQRVAQLAGALREVGVGKGDRVVIYLPMVPEAAFAMLACARIGAVHSVVFGGFAPNELADADRRRPAQDHHLCLLRAGSRPSGRIQAAARRRAGPDFAPT